MDARFRDFNENAVTEAENRSRQLQQEMGAAQGNIDNFEHRRHHSFE